MTTVRFCNCNEFKENGGVCRHLPPLVPGSQTEAAQFDSAFRPLCNCDEWKRLGGVCKHIPPWLSSSSNEVELYPPNKRQRWMSPQAPEAPRTQGQAVRFCNCSEFKERFGICKHLPPPMSDKQTLSEPQSHQPIFQPLCNCDEWKRSGGSCKHIPPWLVPSSAVDDVQLYDPSTKMAQKTGTQLCSQPMLPPSRAVSRPNSPLMFPGYPFCTCTEFAADGMCKHLPDELTHDIDDWDLPVSDSSLFSSSSLTFPCCSASSSSFADDLSERNILPLSSPSCGSNGNLFNPFSFLPPSSSSSLPSSLPDSDLCSSLLPSLETPLIKTPRKPSVRASPGSTDLSSTDGPQPKGKRGRKPAEVPKQDRNREASDKYRRKKKEKMDDLEGLVSTLERTIEEQKQRLDQMAAENKGLVDQVLYLRGVVSAFATTKGSVL